MNAAELEQAFEAEEAAARQERRAAFLAARKAEADAAARDAERVQRRQQAIARRSELRELHAQRLAAVRTHFAEFGRLYEQLNALVELVDVDVQADHELCVEFAGLRATTGEIDKLEPLDVDTLRVAVGLDLARRWDDSAAPLHLWLATASAPGWSDASANAHRTRAAQQLLEQLTEDGHD